MYDSSVERNDREAVSAQGETVSAQGETVSAQGETVSAQVPPNAIR